MKWAANTDQTGATTGVYDGLGQRVQTTVNGETRHLIYDVFGRLVVEYVPSAAPTTVMSDDFNDNTRDTAKWTLGSLSEGTTAYDPAVGVNEVNQRLEITPLSGTTGLHYGGYVSAQTYDLTGGRATVEVVQATENSSGALMSLALVVDSNNWYRVKKEWNNLYLQKKINGAFYQTVIAYSAVQHRYWRIRHDTADQIIWETSGDNVNWTVQRQEARQLSVKSLKVEVQAGT